jgi:hypothetical protein
MRSVGYRVRMWRYRRAWYRRAMASWDTPPNDYQLIRFWSTMTQTLARESLGVKEH